MVRPKVTITQEPVKYKVRTRHTIPSFNGIHYATRSKVLLVLKEYQLKFSNPSRQGKGYTAVQLSNLTGLTYRSMLSSLNNWVKWSPPLVVRHKANDEWGRRKYHYYISRRGSWWLDKYKDYIPIAIYLEEMEAYQAGTLK